MNQSKSDAVQGLPQSGDAIQLAIHALDDELGTLGSDTLKRLGHAREQALESSQGFDWFNTLSSRSNLFSSCASVLAVALMLTLLMPADTINRDAKESRIVSDVLPAAMKDTDLDFYGSIDFLLWLEQQRV